MSMSSTNRHEYLKTFGFDGDVPVDLHGRRVTAVYVYPASVRLWHWLTALSVLVLCVTGYFIGAPLPTLSGPGRHFLMGYIRFAHFTAAWVFAVGLIFRVCYAIFFGNPFSREIFVLPVLSRQWWKEFFQELLWYLFVVRYPRKYIGHNPCSQAAMFTFFIIAVLMTCSGFALFSEGLGRNSWAYHLFGWVFAVFGGSSLSLHEWHRLGMWSIVLFVMVHVYSAIREDIMSRQSIISTMISGFRMFKN